MFLWATYWIIFMSRTRSLDFFFHKKQIKSNKNEFYGEMKNDKLWQMELKIYWAMCCVRMSGEYCGESEERDEVALWLYLQCNKCSSWTLNMHNNPFVFTPIAQQLHGEETLFVRCCSASATYFYNFSLLFHFVQIAQRKELFLICFHSIPLSTAWQIWRGVVAVIWRNPLIMQFGVDA